MSEAEKLQSFRLGVRAFGCGAWNRMYRLGLFPSSPESRQWCSRAAVRLSKQQSLEPLHGLPIDFDKLKEYNIARGEVSPALLSQLGVRVKPGGVITNTFQRTKEQTATEIEIVKTRCCYTEEDRKEVLTNDALVDVMFAHKGTLRAAYNEAVRNEKGFPIVRTSLTSEELEEMMELEGREKRLREDILESVFKKRS